MHLLMGLFGANLVSNISIKATNLMTILLGYMQRMVLHNTTNIASLKLSLEMNKRKSIYSKKNSTQVEIIIFSNINKEINQNSSMVV